MPPRRYNKNRLYRAVYNYLRNDLGVDRTAIRDMLSEVVNTAVRDMLAQDEIQNIIRNSIANSRRARGPDAFERIIQDEIGLQIAQLVHRQCQISVSLQLNQPPVPPAIRTRQVDIDPASSEQRGT